MKNVGKTFVRKDAVSKVTGKEKFIEDYFFDNMVYAKIVRAEEARMRISSIDYTQARKLPGFTGFADYSDAPSNKVSLIYEDWPAFPEKESKYYGEGIAIVSAETLEIAEEAARQVNVNYKRLIPLLDPRKSVGNKNKIYSKDNIFQAYTIKKGNIKKAFKEADIIVMDEFETHYQEHAYMETQGCIAVPQPDNRLLIYITAQCPYYVQKSVSLCLNIPLNDIRIIQTAIGGGFGGKEDVPSVVACQAGILAMKIKRPVKLIYKRSEDMISMSKRHPSITKIKYAAKKNGKITGCEVDFLLNGGAYNSLSKVVLWRGAVHAAGPYDIPNVKIVSKVVATNTVPNGALRGFGQPQSCFTSESLVNHLAYKLNMSPYEIRQVNGLRAGKKTITGHYLNNSVGYCETLEKCVQSSGYLQKTSQYNKYNRRSPRIKKGIGLATAYYGVSLGAEGSFLERAGANIQVTPDGSVIVSCGTTEMGQGTKTVYAQIAADSLGCAYEDIHTMDVDTAIVPDSGPTVASRSTTMSGNAIINAAKPIREKVDSVAMELLNVKNRKLLVSECGIFYKKGNTRKRYSFKDIAKECWRRRMHLSSQGWWVSPKCTFDSKNGQGYPYFVYSYATFIADIELDSETGIVNVKDITCAVDVGKAINPQQCKGQIHGGNVQALGWTLYENLQFDNGKMINANFTDYIIPSAADIPDKMNAILVEEPYLKGPFGAKGFGEVPMVGLAPAIADAVFNASGMFVRKLPLTPENILTGT